LLSVILHILTFLPFLKGNSLVSDAFYFYPYFFIGTELSTALLDKTKSESLLKVSNLKWLFPLFLAGQWFWFTHRDQAETYFPIFFLITLIACYFVYTIAFHISKKSSNDWLAYIGSYSLYIYILHVPVAAVLRNIFLHTNNTIPTAVIFLVCWIGGLLIPVVLFNGLKGWGFKKMFSLKTKSSI
jgi:surface polysaccharide O-acyltransferase-like enzyme